MKAIYFLILLILLSKLLTAQKRDITLEDIFERGVFKTRGIGDLDFRKDEIHYTRLEDNKFVNYEIATGNKSSVLMDIEAEAEEISDKVKSYKFSENERFLLLETDQEYKFRLSYKATCYVYDLKEKKLIRVFHGLKIMYPQFSPASDKIAFVFENNLYFQNLRNDQITQITRDGSQNTIINGASDWVYEEDFNVRHSYEWSPNGDMIAFLRFDESRVRECMLEYYTDSLYPVVYKFKYPKVGEANSKVSVWNYSIAAHKLKSLHTGMESTVDQYIPRLKWTGRVNELCITWMNRQQNILRLILIDTRLDKHSLLLEEKNNKYIELNDQLSFSRDGKFFFWSSEKDGYNQLYRYHMDGQLMNQITTGDFEMTAFYGFNEDQSKIYYQRAEDRGRDRRIYRIGVDGKGIHCITEAPGVHQGKISKAGRYFALSSSTVDRPPVHSIIDQDGQLVRVIEDNSAIRNRLASYLHSFAQLETINNRNGDQLNSLMIKPQNFDSAKKYPVLMFLYGGPGSQQVMNRWAGITHYWWLQMLAQQGYIILVVDSRGTGGRGEQFKKLTYGQLGKYETEDQIDAAIFLSSLAYIDRKRIGIYGWSYGGYLSTLCLLKGNEVFKSAIAVSPVTNWKWYDCVYTERYMGLFADHRQGYEDNSPVYFADRLKGNYLLVHGLADDKVHFQHTAGLTRELILHKKQFETFIYPNRNHGISGDNATIHLFAKMTNFVFEKI
ncbi:MAG: alpha/beta fold hydrolase [Saprospiraceae bacterium]|nr:alpha/beta fold hydrolase [Saprospiraceae bacterium]HMW39518.1 alpha/beta fold hydrolase [Saprospiraceae bacterium]HMX89456.1 alpha/beta fold hydrolase [Saprospiraceae bacterium]HMZ41308.1 alpha/beta fold hydrolase [Saprospiraceae bacterium]HNA65074.1 alpha/beta fold hydrolase [Saprospiraceae bacterium]